MPVNRHATSTAAGKADGSVTPLAFSAIRTAIRQRPKHHRPQMEKLSRNKSAPDRLLSDDWWTMF